MKLCFRDVQPESVHPELLNYIVKHNLTQPLSCVDEQYSLLGAERIKAALGLPDADIHYMPTGTLTNAVCLTAMLKPYEGAVSPTTGHINGDEAGAFEATGHKILPVDTPDGKLSPDLLEPILWGYKGPDKVKPTVLFLTQATEEGSIYNSQELKDLVGFAKDNGMYTYLDGARLAMALTDKSSEMSLKEFAALGIDVFYLGGTKNGGMFGEATVINNPKFKPFFFSYLKRQGGQVQKQRFISLQFARFFDEDQLWLQLADHANRLAEQLRWGLADAGLSFDLPSQANLVFLDLTNQQVEKLSETYDFSKWRRLDRETMKVRFVCTWAMQSRDVEQLVQSFREL